MKKILLILFALIILLLGISFYYANKQQGVLKNLSTGLKKVETLRSLSLGAAYFERTPVENGGIYKINKIDLLGKVTSFMNQIECCIDDQYGYADLINSPDFKHSVYIDRSSRQPVILNSDGSKSLEINVPKEGRYSILINGWSPNSKKIVFHAKTIQDQNYDGKNGMFYFVFDLETSISSIIMEGNEAYFYEKMIDNSNVLFSQEIPSGKKVFYLYDLNRNSITSSNLTDFLNSTISVEDKFDINDQYVLYQRQYFGKLGSSLVLYDWKADKSEIIDYNALVNVRGYSNVKLLGSGKAGYFFKVESVRDEYIPVSITQIFIFNESGKLPVDNMRINVEKFQDGQEILVAELLADYEADDDYRLVTKILLDIKNLEYKVIKEEREAISRAIPVGL